MIKKTLICFVLLWLPILLQADTEFVIADIRVEGLRRITAGTVFNYLPVQVGDVFDDSYSSAAVRALFKTGFFDDVRLEKDGNVLVVVLKERPAIGSISIVGNNDIKSEELLDNLRQIEFAEGRVFVQSQLDQVEKELRNQYFSLGKYSMKIESEISDLDDNRVGIAINISEGVAARIKRINIVGNEAYQEKELLKKFELTEKTLTSLFTGSSQYSKQKLSGDLELLRSYYIDRGYLNFAIDSTQVSITPDKKDIYITININEGNQYIIQEIKLAGALILEKEKLFELVTINNGDLFSQQQVNESTRNIADELGDLGYIFANINAIPNINEEDKTIALTFFIDIGKRAYVRRINFSGNAKTRDEIMRREMRQLESAWASTKKIDRSKLRLERLGYFSSVDVETNVIPNSSDQIDINYQVEEIPLGNLSLGLGYSQTGGITFQTSVSQNNFLGTGNRVSFQFNNSDFNRRFSVGYLNPYYTLDGVSRGFNIFYTETDAFAANISTYDTTEYGGSLNYGLPVSENNFITAGLEYLHLEIGYSPTGSSSTIINFVNENGDSVDIVKLLSSFSYDTRNRAILPDDGVLHRFRGEISVPALNDSVSYYTLIYDTQWFVKLYKEFILALGGELSYGDGFADTSRLPFFENFYAGGPRSVRGYQQNTLGPLDEFGRPIGGDIKLVGNVELITPIPFLEDFDSVRASGFFDIGNVYDSNNDIALSDLRYSVGISVIWVSPLGVVSISLANPLGSQSGDRTQRFQFTFGTSF